VSLSTRGQSKGSLISNNGTSRGKTLAFFFFSGVASRAGRFGVGRVVGLGIPQSACTRSCKSMAPTPEPGARDSFKLTSSTRSQVGGWGCVSIHVTQWRQPAEDWRATKVPKGCRNEKTSSPGSRNDHPFTSSQESAKGNGATAAKCAAADAGSRAPGCRLRRRLSRDQQPCHRWRPASSGQLARTTRFERRADRHHQRTGHRAAEDQKSPGTPFRSCS